MLGRYTAFTAAFGNLIKPVNTAGDWEIGADRGRSRNALVERSLERGSEWILFLDDDHAFPPQLLNILLSRELPVVAGLYLQRTDPFLPIAYIDKDEQGRYTPVDLNDCPQHGTIPVRAAGTGGMLIRSEVFHQIPGPWFIHTTQQSEDLYFCDLLHEHGIPLALDLNARLAHLGVIAVAPDWVRPDGGGPEQWAAGLRVSPSMSVHLPIVMPGGVPTPD
jgi:hypothetical protein